MRGRLWVIVCLCVVGFVVAGCVSPASAPIALTSPASVTRHRFTRTVTLRSTPLSPTAATARVVPGAASPAAPSPWTRFDGVVTGSSFTVVHVRPGGVGISVLPERAPITSLSNVTSVGAPRVLLVIAQDGDWLQVLLPLRPNGSLGWIRRADVDVTTIHQRIEVDRAAHRMHVFDGDALVMDEPVAVGRAATPTPVGQFFVAELLRPPNAGGAYGPYAFTLSAYSNVYQRFGSGDGAVGLHGTNEPRSVGTDASHGCLRVSNDAIRRLAMMLPLGTPVVIR